MISSMLKKPHLLCDALRDLVGLVLQWYRAGAFIEVYPEPNAVQDI
jgi:hypothetical protein